MTTKETTNHHPTIRPVVLSGGAGTRLWPLSRRSFPKQFHRLLSDKSLLQETIARVGSAASSDRSSDVSFAAPIILGSARHGALVQEQATGEDTPALVILEPMAKNTAPAIAALAIAAQTRFPDDVLLVLPADHAVEDGPAFRAALARGALVAQEGRIVTFGIEPTRPETGYGYIQRGEALNDHSFDVARFVEKPDLATAEQYLKEGGYYWNAGIFMFRAGDMIAQMAAHCPAILEAARKAVENGTDQNGALLLDEAAFASSPEDSIDYAVMERTNEAAVTPCDIGWSDIGSWATLWELAEKTQDGNADAQTEKAHGAVFHDCENVLALGDGVTIGAIGVKDLVIVATKDGVLVCPRDRAQDVKKIVEELKRQDRTQLL